MNNMVWVIIGLFVLVWIVSAIVKATQSKAPNQQRVAAPPNRQRQAQAADNPRVERTSNTDIDRFMAEIDRLRNRGEGVPAGRAVEPPRPSIPIELRPRPGQREEKEKERRTRANLRKVPPPPLPSEPVPILKAITPESAPPSTPAVPARTIRPTKTAATAVAMQNNASPLLLTLQTVLKGKQGPAAALILAEIFGEAPGKKALKRAQSPT